MFDAIIRFRGYIQTAINDTEQLASEEIIKESIANLNEYIEQNSQLSIRICTFDDLKKTGNKKSTFMYDYMVFIK